MVVEEGLTVRAGVWEEGVGEDERTGEVGAEAEEEGGVYSRDWPNFDPGDSSH